MTILELVFITTLFFCFYSYFVYPALVNIMGKISYSPWKQGEYTPKVTIIISAYNEEKDIEEKVNNSLQLDYPLHKLEVIVSSDGSTDQTNNIVAGIHDERLILKKFEGRLGKTACLNKVIPEAKGEIIVFTDANSMFAPEMLKLLVKNFHDFQIGAVSGWTKYFSPESGEETTSLYALLEKKTKLDESAVSSCVGADGAIFAIRKELYIPLGANDINDFIIPLNVVRKGKRVILDKDIYCVEETTKGTQNIFKRQVRITTRTAWAIRRNIELLNIFKFKSFSLFLLSHKVIRLLTPFILLFTLILNLMILKLSTFYLITLSGQALFWLLGLIGLLGVTRVRLISICKFFIITFAAQLIGCLRMMAGIEDIMWTPKR